MNNAEPTRAPSTEARACEAHRVHEDEASEQAAERRPDDVCKVHVGQALPSGVIGRDREVAEEWQDGSHHRRRDDDEYERERETAAAAPRAIAGATMKLATFAAMMDEPSARRLRRSPRSSSLQNLRLSRESIAIANKYAPSSAPNAAGLPHVA